MIQSLTIKEFLNRYPILKLSNQQQNLIRLKNQSESNSNFGKVHPLLLNNWNREEYSVLK